MGGLFGGKSNVTTSEQRLNGLVVQSSSFGVRIPLVFGTTRISPNIIDYDDFTAIAHTTSQTSGGKGGGGVTQTSTTYTYTVAVALGICSGPVTGIGTVWKDKELQTADALGLNVYLGNGSQAPWPYMQTYHPEKALNYPYLCYAAGVVDLGDSASTPNVSFEVRGKNIFPGFADANPNDIINVILTDTTSGAGYPAEYLGDNTIFNNYCIANGLFISPGITDATQASEIINNIMQCSNSQPVNSQGKLHFVPYGIEVITGNGATYSPNLSPIYILTDDDYIHVDGQDPVQMIRDNSVDRYNLQQIQFKNRADSYNDDIVTSPDQASIDKIGLRPASVVTLNYICDEVVAQKVADNTLKRGLYFPGTYQFKTPYFPFFLLDPMDIIAMNESVLGMENTLVRIISSEPDDNKEITFTVEEVGLPANGNAVYSRQSPSRTSFDFNIDPGDTRTPIIFNPPSEATETGLETWIAADGLTNYWGSCSVWVSEDRTSYKKFGTIKGPARRGVLTAALPLGSSIDVINTAKVELTNKLQLKSGTQQDAVNLNTLSWLDGEMVAYATAALTGVNKYDLSYIVRGAHNSKIKSHDIGSNFVRIDDAVFKYPFAKEQIGNTIYFKFTSINIYGGAEQDLSEVEEVAHVLSCELPPEVSNIVLHENTYRLKDGTVLSDMNVTFTEPKYTVLDHYNIYYDENNSGTWSYSGSASAGTGYKIKSLPQAKSVKVKITTVNKFKLESNGAITAEYLITGKSDPPPDVSNLVLAQDEYNRANIILKWTPLDSVLVPDLRGYEARIGEVWETATKINSDTIVGNSFSFKADHNGSYTFLVKAIDNSGNYSNNAVMQSISINIVPDAVTNLQAVQEPRDRSMVKVTWTESPGKDIAGYELRYGNDWASGTPINTVKESTYWWYIPASGTYNIMVQARTVAGYVSNISNVSITAMIEAYDVTGFTAVQLITDRTKVRLSWDQPLSLDAAYFEIRKGATWDVAAIVGQRVTGTYYDVIVTEEISQTFWIKAVTVAGNYSLNPAKVEGIFNMNPDPVTNIQISQNVNDKSVVTITWTGISESDLTGYQVKIGYVWETAEALPLTQELKTTYSPLATGDLKVMIKSVNAAGYYSDEASSNLYIRLEPAIVTGLQVLQNGEYNELYWDKHPEPDVVAYEIREGASFDLGTLVASGVTLNSYAVKVDVERNYRYHIKAINRANKYSINAVSKSVFVESLPPKNVILTYDDITLQTGTLDNVEFGTSLINWSNIGGKWSDYPTTKFSDVGGQSVLKLLKTNGVYPTSGTYTCQTVDVGQIITANISIQFVSSVILRGSGSAVLQTRTSRNGVEWTEWQDFRPAQYTFRYLDRRVILATTDVNKTPEVNQMATSIDVDDVEAVGSTLIPVGGSTVSYGKTFYTVPVLTPMAMGDNRFPQVISKTVNGFTVKVVDRAGTDVGGQLDWRAKGY